MRRRDREVTNKEELLNIIRKCQVCRIALNNEGFPYIVPLNFGLIVEGEEIQLYFHGAKEGTKMELIKKDPRASFEMDCEHRLIEGDFGCQYTMEFESVMGTGKIEIVEGEEKIDALHYLMKQYTDKSFTFDKRHANAVEIFKLRVESITGKILKTKTTSQA